MQLTLQNWTNSTQPPTYKCCREIQFHKNYNGNFHKQGLFKIFRTKSSSKQRTKSKMFGLKLKKYNEELH